LKKVVFCGTPEYLNGTRVGNHWRRLYAMFDKSVSNSKSRDIRRV